MYLINEPIRGGGGRADVFLEWFQDIATKEEKTVTTTRLVVIPKAGVDSLLNRYSCQRNRKESLFQLLFSSFNEVFACWLTMVSGPIFGPHPVWDNQNWIPN